MERGTTKRSNAGRALRVALAGGLLVALMAPPGAALAQGALDIWTPYPAISVQPGASASFDIHVTSTEARTVDLAVSGTPTDWTATLRGGGVSVDSVYVTSDQEPELTLDVKVPDGAASGTKRLTVSATSGSLEATLAIEVTVAAQAGGTVALTSEFPNLKGRSDQTFTFTLHLDNDTPQELTFTLNASGPPGWEVEARSATQTQAASFAVDPGGSSTVNVTATPAQGTPSGSYEIGVQAVSATHTAPLTLSVEIVGNVALDLSTPDQRLSTNATAGGASQFTLVVTNTGTSPAQDVTISASPPTDWSVEFDIDTIGTLEPDASQNVVATIKPAAQAIAGDYIVTFRASSAEASDAADVRVTVETSLIWGVVGLAIIALVIGGLLWVFQRYGRR